MVGRGARSGEESALNDQDRNRDQAGAPWRCDEMPCVYCGRLIPRTSQRCPECRTSYSLAVRRASREIEGPWFYLEPRNPSNRGVDFQTMLKLIEKGRLKADSVVRGPTTHQDWMYAAEAPLLSKYLGVCPHCFASAGPQDVYCPTCRRSLDERPARLAPGAVEPGAPSRFPDRDALEEQLASSLATHDMAAAAASAASAATGPGSGYVDAVTDSGVVEPAARPSRRPTGQPHRAKPHVVALLTACTVVPLFVLITYLPLEYVMGDPTYPGSMAYNFRENRLAIVAHYPWTSSPEGAEAVGPSASALAQRDAAEQALAEGRYDEAVRLYAELAAEHSEATPFGSDVRRELAKAQQSLERQRQEREAVLGILAEVGRALDASETSRARALMDRLTPHELEVARAAGVDLTALRDRIAAAEQIASAKERQERMRAEVQKLVGDAALREAEGDLTAALAILENLRNTYPAEFLPQGYQLHQRIASLTDRIAKASQPKQTAPPPETTKQKADRLWAEAEKLHDQGKYDDAIKRLEEIKKLPQDDWPQDLDKRIDYLKRLKWFGR